MRRPRTHRLRVAWIVTVAVTVATIAALPRQRADADPVDRVRVVHITVDSLHPSEVTAATPNLLALKEHGTWYDQARAVMASETLPNHVAMGTGTYPGRNGIPGNSGVADPSQPPVQEADPDLGVYGLRHAYSTFQAIDAECPELQTVGVFSKQYVWRTFSQDPVDIYFDEPSYNIPVSGHAPELATVPAIIDAIRADPPPDYLFANLGDVDRTGHVAPVGAAALLGTPPERQAVLEHTDALVGQIVQTLQDEGLWDSTVLVISSDHSMDYSNPLDPSSRVDAAGALDADPRTAGRFLVSENGGAGFVFLLDPTASDRNQVLADARQVIGGLDGCRRGALPAAQPAGPRRRPGDGAPGLEPAPDATGR